MMTDTIIKIILVAPFVALVLWAIRLRLRLKKMGVKKVYNRPYSDREDEMEDRPVGWTYNDPIYTISTWDEK